MRKTFIIFISLIACLFMASQAMAYQPFPDTGQTMCYDASNNEVSCDTIQPGDPYYGQDAHYQPRLPRSYTKLGQGGTILADDAQHVDDGGQWIMTRDNVTGLVWEVKTNDNKNDTYTWQDAQDVFISGLNNSEFGGYDDWRMPSRQELASLVNRGVYNPAIHTVWFPKNQSAGYWTVTSHAVSTSFAWRVYFQNGYTHGHSKTFSYYVRAVRTSGVTGAALVDNGDGTVTDNITGLMWQKETAPGDYTWKDALAYANGLVLAGYTDWRLPNINELQTLVDDSTTSPAVYPLIKGETQSSGYWSATSSTSDTHLAWNVHFGGGVVAYYGNDKADSYYVRAVRAGHSTVGSQQAGTPSSIHVPSFSSTGNYTISWGSSSTSGVTYVLEEATNYSFTSGRRTAYTGPNLNAPITDRSDGTYYYRVKATKDGYEDSDWRVGDNGCVVNYEEKFGSLQIQITPQEAADAGAQWRRVGTSTWRNSGYTETDVPVGENEVEFKDIDGWHKPSSYPVTIREGQTTVIEQTYTKQEQGMALPGVLMLLLDDE